MMQAILNISVQVTSALAGGKQNLRGLTLPDILPSAMGKVKHKRHHFGVPAQVFLILDLNNGVIWDIINLHKKSVIFRKQFCIFYKPYRTHDVRAA
ncbi:MAG: hypothetical protein J6S83_14050 [Lachnospiraceae bacterium]|nr:hypothetical protein [Lachnospiraceae bacterium]